MFCDARRHTNIGQIFVLSELLVRSKVAGSVYHIVLRYSGKAKCPVKIINSSKVVAAGKAVDI